jgi:hypothetical protein
LFAQFAAFPVWLLVQEHREDAVGEVARADAADPDLLGRAVLGKRPQAPELRAAWDAWRHLAAQLDSVPPLALLGYGRHHLVDTVRRPDPCYVTALTG